MDRFPPDFMFQLTKGDIENLKCQFGIDPYFAASALPQIAQKRDGVSVVIVQCKRGRKLLPDVDVQMFNAQYKN